MAVSLYRTFALITKAVHLGRLIDWCRYQGTKLWTQLEQNHSTTPLNRAHWCYMTLPAETKLSPLIGNTTRVCAQLVSQASVSSPNSPLFLILENPWFSPGIHDAVFRRLSETSLHQASHFSSGGRWKIIVELSDPTGPFRLDFWRSRQLGHFIHSLQPPDAADHPFTTLEEL